MIKKYKVAVFPKIGKRGLRCDAYTMLYNPAWTGCNMVTVEASSGAEAKKRAIEIIKLRFKIDSASIKLYTTEGR